MRLLWLFLALAVLFSIPFVIWGDAVEQALSAERTVDWLRGLGAWAWAAGFALLVSDVVLPVPGTVVMSALGLVYGPLLGGLIASAGSFAAGALAYWACRAFGQRAAERLLGPHDLARGERLFTRFGGWLVVLSRWLPLLPEVIACLAGLARMPTGRFHLALACGSVPVGFTYAVVGHAGGASHPLLTIGLSALLPPLLWLALGSRLRRA